MQKYLVIIVLLALIVTQIAQAQVHELDERYTQLLRRDSGGWTAGDGSISVPLPDGRRLWLFGDSYLVDVRKSDTTLPCLFQVRNAVMVQNGNEFRTLIDSSQTGVQRTFFRDYPWSDTTLYWPNDGFVKADTIYIFLGKIKNDASIASLGNYLAKLHYPDLKLLSITALPDFAKINFGVSIIYDSASGYYFSYGVRANWIVFEPYVARFKLDHLLSGWEYFNGTSWSDDPLQAAKISNAAMGAAFGVVKHANLYYIFSQENGFLTSGGGRHLYAYRSTSPTGPFAGEQLLYTIEDKWKGEYLVTYNAMPHPDIYHDSISIGYNVNGNDSTCRVNIWTERLNADCYRPKFIAVPYWMLDSVTQNTPNNADDRSFSIQLFPNPSNRSLNIESRSLSDQPINIRINTIAGNAVFERTFASTPPFTITAIDLSLLSSGSYELLFTQDGISKLVRFVVAK